MSNRDELEKILGPMGDRIISEQPDILRRDIDIIKAGCIKMRDQMNRTFKEIFERLDAIEKKVGIDS